MISSVEVPQAGRSRTTPPRAGSRRRAARRAVLVAAALLATAVAAVSETAGAQEAGGGEAEVRIAARKLADGLVEFALQQRQGDAWGERMLPRSRFFPAGAAVGRWLASSPLEVGDFTVRIAARRVDDGRVEFALQQRSGDAWGRRMLPRSRFFPAGAAVGRWLTSTPLTLAAAGPLPYTAIASGVHSSCALRGDGTITCWGGEYWKPLNEAPTGGRYTAIAVGGDHACAIAADGTVACWGNNGSGQAEPPEGRYTAVAAGEDHTCGLRADGAVVCWGDNLVSREFA